MKKIHELTRKACIAYQPGFDSLMRDYTASQYNSAIEKLMEKFADLIISECIQTIEDFEIIDRNGTAIEQVVDALVRVKSDIKEKFEVK